MQCTTCSEDRLYFGDVFSFSFTQVTVDWQVPAADHKFYDILFIGTGWQIDDTDSNDNMKF